LTHLYVIQAEKAKTKITKTKEYEKERIIIDGVMPKCAWNAGTRETNIHH
jgi:hypothetical protein